MSERQNRFLLVGADHEGYGHLGRLRVLTAFNSVEQANAFLGDPGSLAGGTGGHWMLIDCEKGHTYTERTRT